MTTLQHGVDEPDAQGSLLVLGSGRLVHGEVAGQDRVPHKRILSREGHIFKALAAFLLHLGAADSMSTKKGAGQLSSPALNS